MAQPHEITFADGTVGAFVELHEHNATIAHLTAELAQSRAETAAAYERAAQVADDEAERILSKQDGKEPSVDLNLRFIALMLPEVAETTRALATEAETTALDRIVKRAVDAETRACAEVVAANSEKITEPYGRTLLATYAAALLARLDQRKEAGK